MTQPYKKRIEFLDIAKGIAVLLMIIGHTKNIPSDLRSFIFSFHMPVFFIISGYTFKTKPFKQVLVSSFKRLLLPYFITCMVMLVIYIIRSRLKVNSNYFVINYYDLRATLFSYFYGNCKTHNFFIKIPGIEYIWFLNCLFVIRLLFNYISRLNIYLSGAVCLAFSVMGMLISKYVWLPFNLDIALVALFFVYGGYVLKRIDFLNMPVAGWLICICVWLLYIPFGHIEMAVRAYPYTVVSLISSLCGSIVFLKFCKCIEKYKYINGFFTFFGTNSLALLCCHNIESYVFYLYKFVKCTGSMGFVICACWKLYTSILLLLIFCLVKKLCERRQYSAKNNCKKGEL